MQDVSLGIALELLQLDPQNTAYAIRLKHSLDFTNGIM